MGNVCWQHKRNRGIRMPKQVSSLQPPKDNIQIQGLDTEDTRMEEARALGIRTYQYGRLPAFLLLPIPNHLPPFIFEDQNMLLHNVNITFISTQLLSSSGHFNKTR